MHLYILTRGIKNWSDQFITELQGKYIPFKFPSKEDPKKLTDYQVQLAVRPIQLYEIVFPEEYKDVVLNTILGEENASGATQHKQHLKWVYALRKMLGVEKIPEYKKDISIPITKQNVEIIGIGIKKDYWQDVKDEKRYDHKANGDCFEAL